MYICQLPYSRCYFISTPVLCNSRRIFHCACHLLVYLYIMCKYITRFRKHNYYYLQMSVYRLQGKVYRILPPDQQAPGLRKVIRTQLRSTRVKNSNCKQYRLKYYYLHIILCIHMAFDGRRRDSSLILLLLSYYVVTSGSNNYFRISARVSSIVRV